MVGQWLRRCWPQTRWKQAVICLFFIPMLSLAQFSFPGVPQLVFDPTVVAKVALELGQAIELYALTTQIYNQIAYSAGWTPIKTPWLGVATPIVFNAPRTIFGETGLWTPAMNTGLGISPAWDSATYGINPPPFYAGYPLGGSSISANIASIMIADGQSQAAMQSIANSRSNQPLNDLAIWNLEFASQDTTLNTNSEVEQLNQLNSGNVLANRQMEDDNALLTTIAEQQILANKIQRDALADNLNVMSIRDTYVATTATAWGGDAALAQSYSQ